MNSQPTNTTETGRRDRGRRGKLVHRISPLQLALMRKEVYQGATLKAVAAKYGYSYRALQLRSSREGGWIKRIKEINEQHLKQCDSEAEAMMREQKPVVMERQLALAEQIDTQVSKSLKRYRDPFKIELLARSAKHSSDIAARVVGLTSAEHGRPAVQLLVQVGVAPITQRLSGSAGTPSPSRLAQSPMVRVIETPQLSEGENRK